MIQDIFTSHGFGPDPILFLAPMEGITNELFRTLLAERSSPDFVATEFIRITGERQRVAPPKRYESTKLQIQLMANEPETLGNCVAFLYDKGVLSNSDWLDLNVGCPSRRVNSSGAGAALLLDPKRLVTYLERMRDVHSGPLSLKTRIGYQSEEDFPEILRALADSPLDFVTIHARTKRDGYDSSIRLDALAQAVEQLPYPVIGNGDIWSAKEGIQMLQETGVRGLMCGRGAVINPFIFDELRGHNPPSKEQLQQFLLALLHSYSTATTSKRPRSGVGRFKEYATWASKHPSLGNELFQRIKREQTFEAIDTVARKHFASAHSFL